MASLENPPAGGDRNTGPALATTIIVFDVLATISVLARLYVRSRLIKQLGFDDVFIVLSLMIWIVAGVFTAFAIHHGLGRHVYYLFLSPEFLADLGQVLKWQYLAELATAFSLFFTRISICLFLMRIFGAIRYWRRTLYCAIAFMTLTTIPSIILIIAQCTPMRKTWDPSVHGKCLSSAVVTFIGYYNGLVSLICDWILASLPILCLWKIQMRSRLKAGICVLMAMGFFSGVCAIVRTAFVRELFGNDPTWHLFSIDIAAVLEQDIGIVAACIPAINPLFHARKATRKSVHQLEDQRLLHKPTNKSTPSSLLARTAQESAETHQTEIEPKSLVQTGEAGLVSLYRRGGDVEAGIVKTVEISHEETIDSVPGPTWFAVSHPQDDGTNFGHA